MIDKIKDLFSDKKIVSKIQKDFQNYFKLQRWKALELVRSEWRLAQYESGL